VALKAVYLDVNIFANERFSSGLFKYIRAILLRFQARGSEIKILSFAHYLLVQNPADQMVGNFEKVISSVPVEEHLFPHSPQETLQDYRIQIRQALAVNKPDLIFVNSVAVFLEDINIATLEEVIASGAKVVMFVVDHLFPTYSAHPKVLVDRYYALMLKTELISCSPLIIDHLYKESGLQASLFLNLFTLSETISDTGSHEYISMVNLHPIKGISIFDKIVHKLPQKKFLLIKNWPDVPSYSPPPNVTLRDLYPDVRDFYQQTKILLVPSLHDEGQPSVISEAMLNGIPVVANAIGGIPEIDSAPGFFLIPPPPIAGFTQQGTILYPKVKEADLESVANQYVKVIESIDVSPDSWRTYSAGLQSQARQSCQKSEASFEKYFKRWSQELS